MIYTLGAGEGAFLGSLQEFLRSPVLQGRAAMILLWRGNKRGSLSEGTGCQSLQGSNQDLNPEPCAPKPICTPDAGLTVVEISVPQCGVPLP